MVIANMLKDHMDLSTQRKVFLSSFYIVLTLLVYTYIYLLIGLAFVAIILWYIFDYIDNSTAPKIDPSGKYVFITGCDSGFGLDSAKTLRDLGFHVIAGVYNDSSPGALELKGRPWVKKVEVVHLDVTSEASVQVAVKEVKDICHDQGLWAVINNAGQNCMGPTELLPMTSYQRAAEINLFGAIRVIKNCLPLIRLAQGRVVNVTSERAFNHKAFSSPYCLSKAGLEAFSNCLRREMADYGVKVVTVAPGEFATATSICSKKQTENLQEPVLSEHAKLSIQDQTKSYPLDKIRAIYQALQPEAVARFGVISSQPVLKAYADAVLSEDPKECYLVHGYPRECLDPNIIMIRLRPFLPSSIANRVERVIYHFLE